jgi:hypothetical protein
MKFIPKLISFLFNPLFIAFGGTLAYFLITPRFSPMENTRAILAAVFIVTAAIPVLLFFLLRNIGWISRSNLYEASERKIPLFIYIAISYIALIKIIPSSYSNELHFYFVGIIGALLATLVLIYFNYKASLHMVGISGLTTFVLGLSFHYEKNIILGLSILFLIMGVVASARLYQKANKTHELAIGVVLGAITQLITFTYWL